MALALSFSLESDIREPGSGQPLDSAEDYPRASSTDHTIVEFQGRRFDQTLPHHSSTTVAVSKRTGTMPRFQSSSGPPCNAEPKNSRTDADPSVNYVMTEVVHCKSKNEVGVPQAAGTCAKRYLNDLLALTNAPVVAVVGRQSHGCLNDALGLGLPEPPYITQKELGGVVRHLVFVWHPASFRSAKTITGLYGEKSYNVFGNCYRRSEAGPRPSQCKGGYPIRRDGGQFDCRSRAGRIPPIEFTLGEAMLRRADPTTRSHRRQP